MFILLSLENLKIKALLATIILLFMYLFSQISQLALTFKEIIFSYRKQSQCKPQVFRSVYVNWPSRSRSGVKFHLVFIVVQLAFILKEYLINCFDDRK